MMSPRAVERPHYFGSGTDLFGVYHPATGAPSKAVLLCPPLGQDLVRCHRIYRQLARMLATRGIAALRFDYHGTGDSAGAGIEVDWAHCVADTLAAARELRTLSGCGHVAGFGARLGGSIALAACTQARFTELLLWDPVLDGAAHAARLDALQQELQIDATRFAVPRNAVETAGQWQGFAASEQLRRQVMELRLDTATIPTLVLDTLPATDTAPVLGGATVTALQPSTPWDSLDRLEDAILAPALVQAAVAHLAEVKA
jgi:alpha/beta superfamily hydrolase